MDQFYTRLCHLGATSKFTNLEEEIRTQFVEQCRSSRLRRIGLREDQRLEDFIKYVRSIEIADRQTESIEQGQQLGGKVYNLQTKECQAFRGRKQHQISKHQWTALQWTGILQVHERTWNSS